jgi:hypothetical protein
MLGFICRSPCHVPAMKRRDRGPKSVPKREYRPLRVQGVVPEPRDDGVRWLHMPAWMVEFDADDAFVSV